MATGHPPLSVSGVTYALHNSRTGRVFLWKRDSTTISVGLFQECSSPMSDQIDSFRSLYDAWDRDIDGSYIYEFYYVMTVVM